MDGDNPDDAVRKIYFEYLAKRYENDRTSNERQHREGLFDNEEPHDQDREAIKRAQEAVKENFGTGQAVNAGRDAFYAAKDGQDFWQKNVDPNSKDQAYIQGALQLKADYVKEQHLKRNQTADASAQDLIDYTRGVKGEAKTDLGATSPDDLIQHTLNSGEAPKTDNASSAHDFSDYTHGLSRDDPNRNSPTRYDELKNLPSQPPPRFRR